MLGVYNTIILYLSVIAFAIITAMMAYRRNNDDSSADLNFFWIILSFFSLWLLLSLSISGKDYTTYKLLFDRAREFDFVIGYHELELGFALFNAMIRRFTDNPNIYFFILNFFIVFLVYYTLYKLREKISFVCGIIVFTTSFFLQALDLKRIYLASAIIFFSMQYLIKKEYFKYFLIVLVATSCHTSAIIMIVPLVYDCWGRKLLNKRVLLSLAFIFIGTIYVFRYQIAEKIFVHRYTHYGMVESDIGLLQIIYHIPLLYIFFIRKYPSDYKIDKRVRNIGSMLGTMSFVIGAMGYFFEAVGRAFVFFMFSYVMAFSMCSKKKMSKSFMKINGDRLLQIMMFLFFIFRLVIYLKSYLELDGIDEYYIIKKM